jgi:hypothetical protein
MPVGRPEQIVGRLQNHPPQLNRVVRTLRQELTNSRCRLGGVMAVERRVGPASGKEDVARSPDLFEQLEGGPNEPPRRRGAQRVMQVLKPLFNLWLAPPVRYV